MKCPAAVVVPKPEWERMRMGLYSDEQVDRIIGNSRRSLRGGLMVVGLALLLPRGWGIGGLSGFMLFSLGVYGLCFRKWRFDPGLWMLAVFLTLTLGACWAYFECLCLQALFVPGPNNLAQPITWDQIRFSADAVVSLLLLSKVVRLAASVAVKNWQRTHAREVRLFRKPDFDPQTKPAAEKSG